MNCDCINLMEVEILRKFEGKVQYCQVETINGNFSVAFLAKMPINEHRIRMEVTYCPFCGKKVSKNECI